MSTTKGSAGQKTFRQLEHELDEILVRVEGASYEDLDDLLKDHSDGMTIINQLEDKLKKAKNSIIKAKK